MTKEEQEEAVKGYAEEFEAKRRDLGVKIPNVDIARFHDVRANCEQIQSTVSPIFSSQQIPNSFLQCFNLSARTGTEILFMAVRSDLKHYNRPFFFVTFKPVEDFFDNVLKTSLPETAIRLEAFMISGVNGMSLFVYLFIVLTIAQV